MKRCLLCPAPAEVNWPVRNSPHCLPCVAAARVFLETTARKFVAFGEAEAPR